MLKCGKYSCNYGKQQFRSRKEMDRVGSTHTSTLQGISQFLLSKCGIGGHKCTISGRHREEKEVPGEFSGLGCVWIHG